MRNDGMLVLSRSEGESIIIVTSEDKITITNLGAVRGEVRIGIKAPRHMPVLREEIFGAFKREMEKRNVRV